MSVVGTNETSVGIPYPLVMIHHIVIVGGDVGQGQSTRVESDGVALWDVGVGVVGNVEGMSIDVPAGAGGHLTVDGDDFHTVDRLVASGGTIRGCVTGQMSSIIPRVLGGGSIGVGDLGKLIQIGVAIGGQGTCGVGADDQTPTLVPSVTMYTTGRIDRGDQVAGRVPGEVTGCGDRVPDTDGPTTRVITGTVGDDITYGGAGEASSRIPQLWQVVSPVGSMRVVSRPSAS